MKEGCRVCSMLIAVFLLPSVASAELGKDWAQATAHAQWSPRGFHSSVVHNQRMWVAGGVTTQTLSDVWWSADGAKWTSASLSAPWGPRGWHGSVVYDGKIWVLGGASSYMPLAQLKNDVWYSTDGVNWTSATLSAAWTPRVAHACVVFGGKMWVIGGWASPDVWYSSDGVVWTSATLSAPWGPRWGHTVVSFNGRLWLLGGYRSVSPNYLNDVWWSADGTTWTLATASASWPTRRRHTSVVADGKIWLLGGEGPDLIGEGWYRGLGNDVWYSSDGVTWTSATLSAAWRFRCDHASVVYDGRIWVLGGNDMAYMPRNDVWFSPPLPPSAPTMIPEPAWTSGTQNTVFWSAVESATTYTVQCDEAADFATPRATAGVSSPTLSYTFTALADGQTYWYRARAENATGPSGWSSPTSSTQDATPPTPPAPPSDAGAFTMSTSVRFNWTAATDPGTTPSGIASYDLQVGTAPGGNNVFNANVGNLLTRQVTGSNGQRLYARVRARDQAGNMGAWSAYSDGILIDNIAPTTPGTPTDAGGFTSSTSVRFNWTAAADPGTTPSGIASYDLQVGTRPGWSNDFNGNVGNVLTRQVTGLNSQTCIARVRARDRAGNIGPWSAYSDGITVDTVRPRLASATARDWRTVEVTFSEAVTGADVATNYSFTRDLHATQACRLSDSQYRLSTTSQTKGASYTVTVGANVRDHAGNSMDTSQRSRAFTGLGPTDVRGWYLYR